MGTFVTVGNAHQPFRRLLEAVDGIAANLPQPVLVQRGHTPFSSASCEVVDFMAMDRFLHELANAELVITHGGATVMQAIQLGKIPVVFPRRGDLGEHVDDHQAQFASVIAQQGAAELACAADDMQGAVSRAMARAQNRVLRDPPLMREIGDILDRVAGLRRAPRGHLQREMRVCIVSSCGGHLTEVRCLQPAYGRHEYFYVLDDKAMLPPEMQERTFFVTHSERDWKTLVNLWEAWRLLRRLKPAVVLSTGAGIVVSFSVVAKLLFGAHVVFVETITRVHRPSLTARLMYWIADDFFYQWESLQQFFPRGRCIGPLI